MIHKMSEAQISRLFNATYDKIFNEQELEALPQVQSVYDNLLRRMIEEYAQTGELNESILDTLGLEESIFLIYTTTGRRFKEWWANLFSSVSELPTPPSDTLNEIHMRNVARQRMGRLSESMRQTARRRAAAIIDKVRQDNPNLDIGEIADKVLNSNAIDNTVDALTMRTVRTEVNAAANEAIQHTALGMNSVRNLKKRWETFGDERVRSSHRIVGMQKPIPFENWFQVGGSQMRFPSDPQAFGSDVPSQTINCRCRMVVIPQVRTSFFGRAAQGLRDFFGF